SGELGVEILRGQRRPPAELDDVDKAAGDLDHAVDLGDREAAVQDVGEAPLARLGAAGREIEGRNGRYCALSAPIVTTTCAASPATARVLASIGATSFAGMPTMFAASSAARR